MPILPHRPRERWGSRTWGFLLLCAALGFYIAGASFGLVGVAAALGIALIVLPGVRASLETAGEDASGRHHEPPPAITDGRPIEPPPLVPWKAVLSVLAVVLVLALKVEHVGRFVREVSPWGIWTVTAPAPRPLAAGDVVLVYRWQRASDVGQVTTVEADETGGPRRLGVIVATGADSTLVVRVPDPPPDPMLIELSGPVDPAGHPRLILLSRRELQGVGVGVVYPLGRRRSLP